ncbi:MAG: hypothetical protein DLM69_00570 [Candidatus Chloroheliales bacterium]|nr:MAG: hypothetical protein DLM69_00570 [Chloroflexota bacterium]
MNRLSEADRRELFAAIEAGEPVSPRFLKLLFPDATNVTGGYELVYRGKMRREDVMQFTFPAPLQVVRAMPEGATVAKGEWSNMLIFGDNLQVLRELADPASPHSLAGKVRLIYIDPPFSTKQDFQGRQEQQAYQDKVAGAQFIEFLRRRLIMLRELLTDDGSIYVHLDSRMAGPIKLIMDELFGRENFRNDITWQKIRSSKGQAQSFGNVKDTILFYAKSNEVYFSRLYTPLAEERIEQHYSMIEPETNRRYMLDNFSQAGQGESRRFGDLVIAPPPGKHWIWSQEKIDVAMAKGEIIITSGGRPRVKRYLDKSQGNPVEDIWTDIPPINSQAIERTSYPTQKPEALLERIIEASSSPGDIVLDCFAGSGTTAAVAERLGRRWVAIDCGKFAIYTIQMRLLNKLKGGQTPRPFTLYNAGLYDYDELRHRTEFPIYAQIALGLFHATADKKKYGQLETQGRLGRWPVLVYDFTKHDDPTAQLDYQTLQDLYHISWGQLPERVYLIVPGAMLAFSPTEYHVPDTDTTFVLLRVPQSVLERVRQGQYDTLLQPQSLFDINDLDSIYPNRADVNDPQKATGFDFIIAPEVVARYGKRARPGQLALPQYTITIERFISNREGSKLEATEANPYPTFAMLLVDPDYRGGVFRLGYHADADEMKKHHFTAYLPDSLTIGDVVKVVYLDIYGNEYTAEVPRAAFDNGETRGEED